MKPGANMHRFFLTFALSASVAAQAAAGDWPMWRYDAQRGNATPNALADNLHLQWERQLPKAKPAWPDTQRKLQFDAAPQPVVLGQRLFVPCTATQTLTAFDTRTGAELWRYFADSPIRFAPVAWGERVCFAADDGYLVCLNAADGKVIWKLNGGPTDRWIIGNDRLTSSWPARGGPVLYQDRIYFTASIWPFMGIFVHAVDPDSGDIVWTNSGDGTNLTVHPHGAKAFGTVVPQGHLAATGNSLIVPGGRSSPAVYDTESGKLNFFYFDGRHGNHHVAAGKGVYFNDGKAYETSAGVRIHEIVGGKRVDTTDPSIIDGSMLIYSDDGESIRVEEQGVIQVIEEKDKSGKMLKSHRYIHKQGHDTNLEQSPGDVLMKAGDRLFVGGIRGVASYDVKAALKETSLEPLWSAPIEGEAWCLFAADDRLFVVTSDARLYCFGAQTAAVKKFALSPTPLPKITDAWSAKVARIAQLPGAKDGYAVALGIGSGRLIEELLQQTKLYVIAVDADAARVDAFRRKMQSAGLYGQRVSAHVGQPDRFALPKYLANLVVSEEASSLGLPRSAALVKQAFEILRPYGGLACFDLDVAEHKQFAALVAAGDARSAELKREGDLSVLVRAGALPGSDDWTHQYGNPGQTGVSRDSLVKAPLGVLWFGGPSNDLVLPRHGHGPSPQVAGGRVLIEGPDTLRAVDVYTGRLLWEKPLKEFGRFYNTTSHFSGAGEIGSNYVSLADKIYAVYNDTILELDAATGALTREFKSPTQPAEAWGYIAVCDQYLIATLAPLPGVPYGKVVSVKGPAADRYGPGSQRLVVYDRHTGKQLWSRDAKLNFRHNAICAGKGTLFCIDSLTEDRAKLLLRRGLKFTGTPTLYALDLQTGNTVWSTTDKVFGTFLNYSVDHDVLLQGGSYYRDRAKDEVDDGMVAYQGADGKVLWLDEKITYGGPCLLWRDKIVTNGASGFALDIKSGKRTGWKFTRMYGCNTALGSEHMLTFRSGAAGFCDLESESGTGNIGGFRSGCTNNLIVANGVLNAPDYTRTCTCTYQNQTSLALIHMPEAEFWTFGGVPRPGQHGFNLGAPGDRRAPNGTLWRAEGDIEVEPAKPDVFRFHSSQVKGEVPNWIVASGYRGVQKLTVETEDDGPYTLKLYFLEPDDLAVGKRVFDVIVQGRAALPRFDIVKEAGAPRKGIVRELTVEPRDDEVVIELSPSGELPAVLSGVELIKR